MRKSVTFFFPYYDVSGVPVLFLNLAEFIAANHNYQVYIVDYKNGYMARNRNKNSKVKLIEFENGNRLYISNTILVMQSILPYAIRPELMISKSTKVFCKQCHCLNQCMICIQIIFTKRLNYKLWIFQPIFLSG